MHSFVQASSPASTAAVVEREAESSLFDVIEVVRDSRWLIGGTCLLGIAAACGYIAVVPPSFEAATLVQIEEARPSNPAAANPYVDTAGLFDNRSPAIAEISVLRSGVVLGEVIERMQLDVSAQPLYVPLVGRWLARRATGPTDPGLWQLPGAQGYVWGDESIAVGRFSMPAALQGKPFFLVVTARGYELREEAGGVVATGSVGGPATFIPAIAALGDAELRVDALSGRAGATFRIEHLRRAVVLADLQRRLKVEEQGKQSGMLKMRLAAGTPEAAAGIVNGIASAYLSQNTRRRAVEVDKTLNYVENALPKLRGEILQAEERIAKARADNAAAELSARGRLALDQSARIEANLMELRGKRNQLSANLLPGHPTMQALDSQIAAASADMAGVNRRIRVLPPVERHALEVSRDLKIKSELYAGLLSGSQQILLAKEGRTGNIRVVDPALPSAEPLGPRPPSLLAAGATAGLVLGLLLSLLRRSLNRAVHDPDDIEWRSSMPVLTTVPFSRAQKVLTRPARKASRDARVLAISAPQDPAVESLRSMRTALERQEREGISTIVVITGPTHAIGKSFTSANLAAVLGASGRKVLLIDADMRKGRLHEAFNRARGPGLSDVLSGKSPRPEVLHRDVAPHVDFLAAGRACPTPADLLDSAATPVFLRECAARYDYVVLDTPPVLAACDAAILGQWAGVVFMIARAEVTTLRELDEAQKRLSQRGVEVEGVIYTGVDISKRRNDIYSYGGYDYLPTP